MSSQARAAQIASRSNRRSGSSSRQRLLRRVSRLVSLEGVSSGDPFVHLGAGVACSSRLITSRDDPGVSEARRTKNENSQEDGKFFRPHESAQLVLCSILLSSPERAAPSHPAIVVKMNQYCLGRLLSPSPRAARGAICHAFGLRRRAPCPTPTFGT